MMVKKSSDEGKTTILLEMDLDRYMQFCDIFRTGIETLKKRYGEDNKALKFWDFLLYQITHKKEFEEVFE